MRTVSVFTFVRVLFPQIGQGTQREQLLFSGIETFLSQKLQLSVSASGFL